MTPEPIEVPSNAIALRPMNPEILIAQAIEKGVSVDTMERLLAMRRELRAEAAKEAFDRALAAFQADCPTIQKTKKVFVKGALRYCYAPLESIVEQVKGLLQTHGFSYMLDAQVEPGWVTATCELTHSFGHSKKSNFKVPIDKDAYMGEAQKFASALTFAKRYCFQNSLGILTGDEDDDSQTSSEPMSKTAQAQSTLKTPFAKAPASKPTPEAKAEPKKATSSDVLPQPKDATDATRLWFMDQLRSVYSDEDIRKYFEKMAFILPGAEKIDDVPLRFVPTSRVAMAEFTAQMTIWAVGVPPETSGDDPEYFKTVIHIPRKGMKRVDYMKSPDTIGSLYHALKGGDADAGRRLWGLANMFEVKQTWVDGSNKQHPRKPSEIMEDNDLRAAFDQFIEEHGDEDKE